MLDFYGAVDIASGRATLFMPKLPQEYLMWCGTIYPPDYFIGHYGVDEGFFNR